MPISLKTQKMLWGRAANRCAICRLELVMDASETDDESLVGEACHIVAQKEDGPRGVSLLTAEQRDKFANLILLCNVHHKQIDDQVATFPVERLAQIKVEHEAWVRASLSFDSQRQREDEIYADYIDTWATLMKLDDWNSWASWLVSGGQPSLQADMNDALNDVRRWLLSRVWPGRYNHLEGAFTNFRRVAQDLCNTFHEHAHRLSDGHWETERFYQIDRYDPELYFNLLNQFEEHVDLVQDLALELTRAANYVCDMVRLELMPSFRLKEGVALIEGGPYSDFSFKTYRVEYCGGERTEAPYPGLEGFKVVRFSRDVHFGEEQDET